MIPRPLPDFLYEPDPGEIRLTGHRIGLYTIMREFKDGASPEGIAADYDLSLLHVYKVIVFYLENTAAVDEYVRAYRAELERQAATGRQADVAKLRARMDEIRRSQTRAGA